MKGVRSSYTDRQVARAKALMRIATVKSVASRMGAPYDVVRNWRRGAARQEVAPDLEFLALVERLLREP